MAHNRVERRRKMALIKRKLEFKVQRELADYAQREAVTRSTVYTPRSYTESVLRRRQFKNEGRHGRNCWDCGQHACDWCLDGFYSKHYRRAQALENDLKEYLIGGYDALRAEGDDIPTAPLVRLPSPMKRCEVRYGDNRV